MVEFEANENRQLLEEQFKRICKVPVIATGPWAKEDVSITLSWGNGHRWKYINDPQKRAEIKKKYSDLSKSGAVALAPKLAHLKSLSPQERKKVRMKIRPFPGLVAASPNFTIAGDKLKVSCQLNNFIEVATLNNPNFLAEFPNQQKEVFQMARGLGIGIIVETLDGFHIFGVRGSDVIGGGKVSILGATPNITHEQLSQFISPSTNSEAKNKRVNLPGSWLFSLVSEDIIEPEELNTNKEAIENLSLIGINENLELGWVMFAFYCKLKLGKEELQRGFLKQGSEHTRMVFVPKDSKAILEFISQHNNVSSGTLGVYHTYFESLKQTR